MCCYPGLCHVASAAGTRALSGDDKTPLVHAAVHTPLLSQETSKAIMLPASLGLGPTPEHGFLAWQMLFAEER